MKLLLGLALLLPVASIKIVLVILGLVLVPITNQVRGLYRKGIGRPDTYWERAIRNPVGGFGWLIKHPPTRKITTRGSVQEPGSTTKRVQARLRYSGLLVSVRLLWKYSEEHYGEMYLGWKLRSAPPELDFALSLRLWADVGN